MKSRNLLFLFYSERMLSKTISADLSLARTVICALQRQVARVKGQKQKMQGARDLITAGDIQQASAVQPRSGPVPLFGSIHQGCRSSHCQLLTAFDVTFWPERRGTI